MTRDIPSCGQTVQPEAIWVCVFSSQWEALTRDVLERFGDKRMRVFASDYNLKYYGRFQLALQVACSAHVRACVCVCQCVCARARAYVEGEGGWGCNGYISQAPTDFVSFLDDDIFPQPR
jgi:hypothetical protein